MFKKLFLKFIAFLSYASFLRLCLIFLFLSAPCCVWGERSVRVVFYNVENYFDCVDDPVTNDTEFTPDGSRHWTKKRFWQKTENLSKVLAAIGQEGAFPDLVGMAEVENREVVETLLHHAGQDGCCRVIHRDSPDRRGIDVCLVYNRFNFRPVDSSFISIRFPGDSRRRTRDLLYVKGVLPDGKPLHVVVSHWPSKSGGDAVSEPLRCHVADRIRLLADSILKAESDARLLIMGDFNAAPYETPVLHHLKALPPPSENPSVQRKTKAVEKDALPLFNLMYPLEQHRKVKSYKYHDVWSMLDQMVVSTSLKQLRAEVFHPDFLLVDDESYLGEKPFRTFVGYRYQGGYSDHLPVYIDIPLDRPK